MFKPHSHLMSYQCPAPLLDFSLCLDRHLLQTGEYSTSIYVSFPSLQWGLLLVICFFFYGDVVRALNRL